MRRTLSQRYLKGKTNNSSNNKNVSKTSVFCSDLYTAKFVKACIRLIALEENIVQLEMEDLITRDFEELNQTVQELFVNTTLCQSTEPDAPCSNTSSTQKTTTAAAATSSRGGGKTSKTTVPKLRYWKEIVFVDSISDANSYKEYLTLKKKIYNALLSFLNKHGLDQVLPIRFKANIEIHSLLEPQQILELLQAIQKDDTITRVQFRGSLRYARDIPKEFQQLFDPESLSVEEKLDIYLHYDQEAMNISERHVHLMAENSPDASVEFGKGATKGVHGDVSVIRQCTAILKKLMNPDAGSKDLINEKDASDNDSKVMDRPATPDNNVRIVRRSRSPPRSPPTATSITGNTDATPLRPTRSSSISPDSKSTRVKSNKSKMNTRKGAEEDKSRYQSPQSNERLSPPTEKRLLYQLLPDGKFSKQLLNL